MTRILFVDDDPMVLSAFRRFLRRKMDKWDTEFCESGQHALERFGEQPFDIVVSDMRMPGMDGADLLKTVREISPSTVRVVLSGYSDPATVERVLPVAHRFLSKPCLPSDLIQVVEGLSSLSEHGMDPVARDILGAIDTLPSPPQTFSELSRTIRDPRAGPRSVGRVIEQDMAMSAKLLQLVNSAFFGTAKRVTSLDAAVTHLGMSIVSSLVLTLEVFEAAQGIVLPSDVSLASLQRHAVLTQQIASLLMKGNPEGKEAAAVGGLLHDIGILVLAARLPDRLNTAVESAKADGVAFHEAEREVIGTTHASVGAYLLGLWGLPTEVVDVVTRHHDTPSVESGTLDPAGAVHVADLLATEAGLQDVRTVFEPDATVELDALACGPLGERLPDWRSAAAEMAGAI